MLRTTLFHIALLLAPAVLYFLYLVISRKVRLSRSETAKTLRKLPWPWLLFIGIGLMAISLVFLSINTGENPDGTYIPPRLENGEIVPATVD